MQVAHAPVTTPAQRVRAVDVTRPLVPMDQLDVVPDGALTVADAEAFEQVAAATRTAPPGAGSGPEYASQLDFAAQQARFGAALLADGPIPSRTVQGIVPTPNLDASTTPAGLIDAIKAVDVQRLQASGVRPVATFDVDGTSLKGDIFLPFAELMARQGRFRAESNPLFQEALAKIDVDQELVARNDANANALLMVERTDATAKVDTPQRLANVTSFFALGDALKGYRLDELQGVARHMMEHGSGSTPAYKGRVNDDTTAPGDSVRDVVGALKQQGITPHIVTYGFDWLAATAAPYLGIDPKHVIGTHSEVVDGVLTGVHDGRTIASKDVMVRREAKSPPIFAFGDTSSDLPMLDIAAGRGVVVNPSDAMRTKMAERNGALGEVRYSSTAGELAGS